MPGTGTPDPVTTLRPATSAWHNLAWKLLIAILILLLMSAGIPVSPELFRGWIWVMLLVWGGLVVGVAASNMFDELRNLRWAWVALAVGAYAALSAPGIVGQDPSKLVDALGPVVALTLAAHLARRDLPQALRDWAVIVGLALYAGLGVTAMWLVISSFGSYYGLVVFVIAALLPPLTLEVALLLLRRVASIKDNLMAQLAAVVISTVPSIFALSFTQLNGSTRLFVALIFGLFAGLLIGGALFVSLLTRPMIEAASGARNTTDTGVNLGRALVELSHGAVLISLAIYIPLRLVAGGVG